MQRVSLAWRKPNHLAAFGLVPGRRFSLAETTKPPGVGRFVASHVVLAEGATQSWVTVTRTGRFYDPRYGDFEITLGMLQQMLQNFGARILGQDVFIDVAHDPEDGSAGQVLRLAIEGTKLRALVEWTPFGVDAIKTRGFAYLSADYHENYVDNEQRQPHGCVLMGAGLTLRPVIKHLDRVQLSADSYSASAAKLAINPSFLKTLEFDMNKYLKALEIKLLAMGLLAAHVAPILPAAAKQLATVENDEAKALAMVDVIADGYTALAAEVKRLAEEGRTVTLSVVAPTGATPPVGLNAADVAREVNRVLAEQATAADTARKTLAQKQDVMTGLVNGATTLDAATREKLLAAAKPMVTADMSDEQVKALGEFMLSQAASTSAAVQLAALGYHPASGSLHISVDSSNGVKSLQEQVDRRLGITTQSDARRYERTGGMLLAENKAFAEKALQQFDALNGARLLAEHKMLAAGTGQIGDFSVPAVFERTVLRESLYQLVGLNYVEVGTAPMAAVVQMPYSYRDTTAAGVAALRTYELQAIRNAGVIQTTEEARPLPQKLAFKVSNEMRYLLGAAPIDFDPLAENVRNIIRITGEDTDRMIQNEVLNSADEHSTATVTDTLTAQVNGTNKIFVTSQFPVVRPRKVYDLKGAQVGSTVNPIVVTLNAVVRSEYVSGVTLAAGLYYVLDYNLGELRFVNEAGVLQAPTNAWVLTISYTWTQNCAKSNLDLTGADVIGDVYDRILTQVGARKVVIENDRYYTANMMLMSGAVDNAVGQAKSFQANASRPGAGLNPDGSIAIIKGIPAFNTRAPGLAMGDARIVVGQRSNTRFRMLKPFQMNEMQQSRDSSGNFIGAMDGYGEQFVAAYTPTMLRNANTSLVLYSATGRVARVA